MVCIGVSSRQKRGKYSVQGWISRLSLLVCISCISFPYLPMHFRSLNVVHCAFDHGCLWVRLSSLVPVKVCVPTHLDQIPAVSFFVSVWEQLYLKARHCKRKKWRQRRILDELVVFMWPARQKVQKKLVVVMAHRALFRAWGSSWCPRLSSRGSGAHPPKPWGGISKVSNPTNAFTAFNQHSERAKRERETKEWSKSCSEANFKLVKISK